MSDVPRPPHESGSASAYPDGAFAEAILDLAVDAIVTIDESGGVHSFNAAAERIFGYRADEVLGRNVNMLMGSPHRDQHDEYLKSYLETGEAKIIGIGRQELARRKDGSVFPMELAISQFELGGKRWFAGILRDVTERKVAEEALRKERDFTSAVLDTTGSLVLVLDRDSNIVRFNRACEALTGYSAAEMQGKPVWELIPMPQVEDVQSVFRRLLDGGGDGHFENEWRTRSGSRRLIAWSNTTMPNPSGEPEYVIATGLDITEQRHAQAREAQQEKLAAVGQLASGIAHEIGNPLASIFAVTQTVVRKSSDPFVREKLGLIGKHIDRISTTVRQMMDFARPPRLEWRLTDVNAVLSEAVEIVRYDKRAKRVEIPLELASELPPTYAVPDLLGQVFVNIALNGLDALESLPDNARRVLAISTEAEDSMIRITFEDSGTGIPPEIQRRIMDPFFTTKDVGKGTGLGLAVSYRTVRDHDGEIRVSGRPGQGACFTVELPVQSEAPLGPTLLSPYAPPSDSSSS